MVGTFRGLVADSSLPGVRGRHQGGLRCNCENTVSSKGSWDVRAKSLRRHQSLLLQSHLRRTHPIRIRHPPPQKTPPPLWPPLKIELIRIPPSTAPKMSLPPPRRPPIPSRTPPPPLNPPTPSPPPPCPSCGAEAAGCCARGADARAVAGSDAASRSASAPSRPASDRRVRASRPTAPPPAPKLFSTAPSRAPA